MRSITTVKHRMKGFAVWNTATGALIGAGPTEDRAKACWCITRGPTTYGKCVVTVEVARPKPLRRKRT